MVIAFGLSEVRVELGADPLEQLIETTGCAVCRGGTPHAAMAGIHRHRVAFRA